MDLDRAELLENWLKQQFPGMPHSFAPASADASFRRYSAEGRLCTADPFRRRRAALCETPAPPPQGRKSAPFGRPGGGAHAASPGWGVEPWTREHTRAASATDMPQRSAMASAAKPRRARAMASP